MKSRTKLTTCKALTKDELAPKALPKKNTTLIVGEVERAFGKDINNIYHLLKENLHQENIQILGKKPTSRSVYERICAKSIMKKESTVLPPLPQSANIKNTNTRLPENVDQYYHQITYHLVKIALSTPRIDQSFLSLQKQITAKHREDLVTQLVQIHSKFKLLPATLFKTINLMDRYLSQNYDIQKRRIELLGIACLFISAKYEEIYPPSMRHYIDVLGKRFSNVQIIDMEGKVLKLMQFNICDTTAPQYIDMIGLQFSLSPRERFMCLYLAELAFYDSQMAKYHPLQIAIASGILAKSSSKTDILDAFDRAGDQNVRECANSIQQLLKQSEHKQSASKKKYSKQMYLEVGKLSSLSNL